MQNQRDVTKYCSKCRNELKDMEDFRVCPNCGKQFYFNPKPTVAIWLTNDKNEVLLTKRAREPFKDWWDIPGGFVEENETLEEAIKRELKEETNLEAKGLEYAGSLYGDYAYGGELFPVVVTVYRGTIKSGVKVTVADDVSDYKFVPKNEVDFDSIAFETQRDFLKKLK